MCNFARMRSWGVGADSFRVILGNLVVWVWFQKFTIGNIYFIIFALFPITKLYKIETETEPNQPEPVPVLGKMLWPRLSVKLDWVGIEE